MIDPHVLLQEVRALPSLSPAVARLQAVLRDPRSSAADVEAALRMDPAMTGNLLRLANSAAVGLRRKVGSVREAVTLLGVRAVFDLTTQAAFAGVIPDTLPGYEIDARTFWFHCAGVSILAEELGKAVKSSPPNLATAALLHDVGKLVASLHLGHHQAAFHSALEGKTLANAEAEVLGHCHGDIGAMIAAHWQLPDPILAAIRWHHHPDQAPAEHQRTADLVHIADAMAHSFGFGADVGELQRDMQGGALHRLGVDVRHLEAVAAISVEKILDLRDRFRPAGGHP